MSIYVGHVDDGSDIGSAVTDLIDEKVEVREGELREEHEKAVEELNDRISELEAKVENLEGELEDTQRKLSEAEGAEPR